MIYELPSPILKSVFTCVVLTVHTRSTHPFTAVPVGVGVGSSGVGPLIVFRVWLCVAPPPNTVPLLRACGWFSSCVWFQPPTGGLLSEGDHVLVLIAENGFLVLVRLTRATTGTWDEDALRRGACWYRLAAQSVHLESTRSCLGKGVQSYL